ncbi:GtrA family protein [Streptomyces sp. NPDC059828]|uniref:GtrA family protein n=1 Tax=Streptomyces sp. NPDC059828 TaxID=3346965 RepID=UPI0036484118
MTVQRQWQWQMVRFALVGAVNTGTYYGCYLLLLTWLPYIAAHAVAFALSMTGSFFLNAYFTYRTRPTWRKFLLFPLTNAANFVITTAGVYLLVGIGGYSDRWSPLAAAAAAIPITFALSRAIMLRPDRKPEPDPRSAPDSRSQPNPRPGPVPEPAPAGPRPSPPSGGSSGGRR